MPIYEYLCDKCGARFEHLARTLSDAATKCPKCGAPWKRDIEKRLVKVHEPYQMLGLLEDDLQNALGIDVEGVFPRKTMFGFSNHAWKFQSRNHGLLVGCSNQPPGTRMSFLPSLLMSPTATE